VVAEEEVLHEVGRASSDTLLFCLKLSASWFDQQSARACNWPSCHTACHDATSIEALLNSSRSTSRTNKQTPFIE
jgi:hypothetical protein